MDRIPEIGEHAIYADTKQFGGKITRVLKMENLEGYYLIGIDTGDTDNAGKIMHVFAVKSSDWYDPMQTWISIPEEHRYEWVINIFNTALVRVSGDASI
jgi:hypothetical protein